MTANLRLDLLYRTLDPVLHPADYLWGLDRDKIAREKEGEAEREREKEKEREKETEKEKEKAAKNSKDRRRRQSVRRSSRDKIKDRGSVGGVGSSTSTRDREYAPSSQEQQLQVSQL